MRSPMLSSIKGIVTIVVSGDNQSQFINEMTKEGIVAWDLKPLADGGLRLKVSIPHFFLLRPVLKRTGCRLTIQKRSGLPFTLSRLWKRKGFIIGFILFTSLIFGLTSIVWDVQVQGNHKIAEEDILRVAKEEGLHRYQWIYNLSTQDKLAAALTRKLPTASWVGISRVGTKYVIEVVEASQPKDKNLLTPHHLVSKTDAVISHIYAERGQPRVKKNDRVRKGQILISGIQGGQTVVSKGVVKGIVWHEYDISVPLTYKQKVYTGNVKRKGYLYFGQTAIQLSGYGKNDYDKYRVLSDLNPVRWRDLKLPFGYLTESIFETTEMDLTRTIKQAQLEGIERARSDVLAKYGIDSVIQSEKILHEKTDNGKVYMKVLFEVEQDITEELPLVHSQGE
ncbi:sporulation protein YqfD [Paenibacillus turicensis]|uniref:sporulation protein YqfD n=1 Tax=Paenibacillus turicensis TaxID=160487 RepID=UPI003D28D3BE